MEPRQVKRTLASVRTVEGAGFVVRRPFPVLGVMQVDPFLLLDEMGPIDYHPGEATGAPDHPHRGFETVTYIIEGEAEHEDSAGNRGFIGAGDVQWMTAGRGIVHSEMPSSRMLEKGGRMHGFQLWVNLPAADKMIAPRYQEVPSSRLPRATTPDGLATVKVIAGEALGAVSTIETHTPIAYHHWTLRPGARVELPLAEALAGFAYVFKGTALVGAGGSRTNEGDCALFEAGGPLRLAVPDDAKGPAELLVVAGRPLGEPVARYGPFVMNTRSEIEQAFADYRAGRLGEIRRGPE